MISSKVTSALEFLSNGLDGLVLRKIREDVSAIHRWPPRRVSRMRPRWTRICASYLSNASFHTFSLLSSPNNAVTSGHFEQRPKASASQMSQDKANERGEQACWARPTQLHQATERDSRRQIVRGAANPSDGAKVQWIGDLDTVKLYSSAILIEKLNQLNLIRRYFVTLL